jgi:hypothetical protein
LALRSPAAKKSVYFYLIQSVFSPKYLTMEALVTANLSTNQFGRRYTTDLSRNSSFCTCDYYLLECLCYFICLGILST